MKFPMLPRIILLLGFVGRFTFSAFAFSTNEIPQYNSRIWQMEDGLPHKTVQALAQTRDGYIWVGMEKGLARFDGIQFVALMLPELKYSSITALCEGGDDSLWIGTSDQGILQLKEGKVFHFTTANGLCNDSIRALFATRYGSIWIGTTNGLSRFLNGHFSTFTTNDGLLHPVIRSFFEDARGNLWIGTGHGLNRWKDGKITAVYDKIGDETLSSVRAIYVDADDVLWFGANAGLARV
ncbi:MAG: ligand-binding sensor domain-containing protein, partial [Limisphaerales bacterium]